MWHKIGFAWQFPTDPGVFCLWLSIRTCCFYEILAESGGWGLFTIVSQRFREMAINTSRLTPAAMRLLLHTMGHFTLARLRAQLRKSWGEPEPSLRWAFNVNKVQLGFSVQAWNFLFELQDVHTSGSARAWLGIWAEPVWNTPIIWCTGHHHTFS